MLTGVMQRKYLLQIRMQKHTGIGERCMMKWENQLMQLCATADHSHAGVAANAIQLWQTCILPETLTHTVYESRLLTKLAAKYKVATQMGNQGSSARRCKSDN
jgi:hypothetical protein